MIYSRRLRLRGAEREDIPRFVSWLNDPEVYRHLLLAYPLSQAAEEKWFDAMVARGPAEQILVIEARIDNTWMMPSSPTPACEKSCARRIMISPNDEA